MPSNDRRSTLADATRLGVPIVLVVALLSSAIGVGAWLDGFRDEIVAEVRDVGYRVTTLEGKFNGLERAIDNIGDGHATEADIRLWIERARRVYPELPDYP